jgi:hypothetical protein
VRCSDRATASLTGGSTSDNRLLLPEGRRWEEGGRGCALPLSCYGSHDRGVPFVRPHMKSKTELIVLEEMFSLIVAPLALEHELALAPT